MAAVNKKNVGDFQTKLLIWYLSNGRDFPWRKSNLTPYKLIIAEVLLQRTKAETVKGFYNKFLRRFPSWKSLSTSNEEVISNYLKPIGLHRQRGKRLKNLAVEMARRNGKLPHERDELENIPFFGQYMINAIELLIFKKDSPLIDVNMSRVLERYFRKRQLSDIRYDPFLQSLATSAITHKFSRELNWAILDFAALICIARNPRCNICMLTAKCTYFKSLRISLN